MDDLFRAEVLRRQHMRLSGDVVIRTRLGRGDWLWPAILMVAPALALLLVPFPSMRLIAGRVYVSGRPVEIVAPTDGLIVSAPPTIGSPVIKGELVGVVSPPDYDRFGQPAADSQYRSILEQMVILRRGRSASIIRARVAQRQLESKRMQLQAEATELRSNIILQNKIIDDQSKIIELQEPLVAKGFITLTSLAQKLQLVLQARQGLETLRARMTRNQVDVQGLRDESEALKAANDAELSRLDTEISVAQASAAKLRESGTNGITAPYDGFVSEVYVKVGDWTPKGGRVAALTPNHGGIYFELELPEDAVGKIKVTDAIKIRVDALRGRPGIALDAEITKISTTPTARNTMGGPPGAYWTAYALLKRTRNESYSVPNLRSGMGVTALLVKERASIGELLYARLTPRWL
jgi:biotin carboxyl carrier protein